MYGVSASSSNAYTRSMQVPEPRRSGLSGAFAKQHLDDLLLVPVLTKFGTKTAKDIRVHNILAKDIMQQAPWRFMPGERFATLKKLSLIHI